MSRTNSRTAAWIVAAALAAAPAPAAAVQQGVGPGEITLGVTAAFKGGTASLGVELYRGYAAYFQKINDGGGVNGRKIRLVLMDDGYDPPRAVQNAIKLIEGDQVFLLFGGVGTPTTVGILPLLKRFEDRSVLMFSPFTGAQPQREPPYEQFVFNVRASYREETEGLVDLLWEGGYRKIAVLYQSDSYGKSGQDGIARALKQRRSTPVTEVTYTRGTRFEAALKRQVEIVAKSGADAVIAVGAYEPCAAFVRDARDAGFTGPIANISFVGPEAMLALLKQHGQKSGKDYTVRLVNSQVVPFYRRAELAAVEEYQQLIRRYSPKPPAEVRDEKYQPADFSFGSLEGYLNARVLVEAFRRMGTEPFTTARFTRAMESLSDYDLGLDVPLQFGPGSRQGLHKVYFTTVLGGDWAPLTSAATLR